MSNMHERNLVLTLSKIFNWGDSQQSSMFKVSFFSLKTSSLILDKRIKASFVQNQAIFNYSLRVAYHSDQNEILIKLYHFSKMNNTIHIIGEFALNLDNLVNKKMQFFPFGKNDKVLKITVGDKETLEIPNHYRLNIRNQQFIKQKEQFLMKITKSSSTSRLNDNSRSKKTFSEQAKHLMFQVKSMKQEKPREINQIQQEFNDYFHEDYDPNKNTFPSPTYNKIVNKSSSQRNLISPKTGRNPISKRSSKEDEYQKKSNRSQKHKLALKSLEMVPCKNEYYEQSQYQEERRGSMNPQTKAPIKKRLIKSQLY